MRSFTLCSLLFVTCLAAQQPTWQLPNGGLAAYLAEEEMEPEPANARLPGCLLPHAPLLLQSELAADARSVAMEAQDWRWIAPLVAFDLRLAKVGKVTLRLPRVPGLGDLAFTGTAMPPGADGHQRFELQWKVEAPTLRPGEKALVAGGKPLYGGSGQGTLQLDRKFDAKRGVVEEFSAKLALDVAFGPFQGNGKLAGIWSQHWVLRAVQGHREAGFDARVAEAIRNGCLSIQHALQPDRPEFATVPAGKDHPCGEGRLALAIQTLLVAGHSPTDEFLVQALAELRRRDIRETYSLAVAIAAIEQQYAPAGERDSLLAGGLQHPVPRTPGETDRALLTEWRQRLLQNRDSSVDNAYRSRFWYLGGKGFDNSNSQYALLGLWSAQLCQLPTDRGVWLGAAEHWLAAQHPAEGKPRGLQLTDLRVLRDQGLAAAKPTASARTAVPRGFSYTLPGSEAAYGSMTCAGITGLALCMAALAANDSGKPTVDNRLEDALRNGFAWLSQHRTVRWNAGAVPHRSEFYFYWLYSLERACELSRIGLIDGWDWYHDGAQVLLALQDDNGRFGEATLEEQCLAVLFLKKAQLPAITGAR